MATNLVGEPVIEGYNFREVGKGDVNYLNSERNIGTALAMARVGRLIAVPIGREIEGGLSPEETFELLSKSLS